MNKRKKYLSRPVSGKQRNKTTRALRAPTGTKPRVLRRKLCPSDRDNDRAELRWTAVNSNEGKNAETVVSSPLSRLSTSKQKTLLKF